MRWVCAVLAGLAAAVAAAQPASSAPSELLEQGVAAFEAGLYEVAARSFRRLVSTAPGAREAVPASFLEALSLFYAAAGAADASAATSTDRHTEAAQRFAAHQRRFRDSPYQDQIWYWIGAAWLAAGDAESALTAVERHLGQSGAASIPFLEPARETQARALEQLGRGVEALDRYEDLLAASAAAGEGHDPVARARWLERTGMLLLEQGQHAAAAARFDRIWTDYPQSPQAAEALFFAAEAEYFGADPGAAAGYRRYLDLFPEAAHRVAAHYRLARLLLAGGDPEGARQLLENLQAEGVALVPAAAAAPDPGAAAADRGYDPVALALLTGDVRAASGDWEGAVTAYNAGLANAVAAVRRQVLALNLALALIETGAPLQALVTFEEAAAGPDSAVTEAALYQRLVLLVQEQRLTDAAAELERFLERFPDSERIPAVERLLIEVSERIGDHQGLLRTLQRVAERRRLTPEEEQRRGIALLWLGDDIAALETLSRRVSELSPADRAESWYRIGAVYARRGEFVRAEPFFGAALEDAGGAEELRQRAAYALAASNFNIGNYAAALALLEKATSSAEGPWLAAGRFVQAATLYRLGRVLDAAEYFGLAAAAYAAHTAAPDLMPDGRATGSAARSWQALALFRGGELEAARALFRELATGTEEDPGVQWYRAGLASARLEDHATAVHELQAALAAAGDAAPLVPAIHYELARLYLAARDLEAADHSLQQLESRFPSHRLTAIGGLQRADTLRALGRLREAVAAYQASAARESERTSEAVPGLAELARYAAIEVLEELPDAPALLEAAWGYLMHHPQGARADRVAERLRTALLAAAPATVEGYFRRATAAAAGTPAAADPVRLAYAELLLSRDTGAAEQVLRELLAAPSSDQARSEALLLLGRAYEAGQRWADAASLYRGLALAGEVAVATRGALGVARVLAESGDHPAAAEEYGAVALRFEDYPEVAGEAWFRGAVAHRDAGNLESVAVFARRLRDRFPDSSWAHRAAEQFPGPRSSRVGAHRAARRSIGQVRLRLPARSAQDGGAQGAAADLAHQGERFAPGQNGRHGRRAAAHHQATAGGKQGRQRRQQRAAPGGSQVGVRMEQRQIVLRRRGAQGDPMVQRHGLWSYPALGKVGTGGEELQGIAAYQGEARAVAGRSRRRPVGAGQPHRKMALSRIPSEQRRWRGGGRLLQSGTQHEGHRELGQVAGSIEVRQPVDGGQGVGEAGQGYLALVALIGRQRRGRGVV